MEVGPAAFASVGAEFAGGVETAGFAFAHCCCWGECECWRIELGKMCFGGGLGRVEYRVRRIGQEEGISGVLGRLTDGCVIAGMGTLLLWCKAVVGEDRCLEKLSECG